MIPRSVQIGPITYSVELVEDLHEVDEQGTKHTYYGSQHFITAAIKIMAEMNPRIEASTFLHEITHGILENSGYHTQDESLVDAIAYGFYDLIRQNPDLILYLQQSLA